MLTHLRAPPFLFFAYKLFSSWIWLKYCLLDLKHHDWIQVFIESVLFIYVFFWVLVWPCQLFVHLWYRVSGVLDLSLVSKRFGFWPHITHVIVLTFKEIKHLSDYRTVGPSDYRTVGLSDCRIIGRTPKKQFNDTFLTIFCLFSLLQVLFIKDQ